METYLFVNVIKNIYIQHKEEWENNLKLNQTWIIDDNLMDEYEKVNNYITTYKKNIYNKTKYKTIIDVNKAMLTDDEILDINWNNNINKIKYKYEKNNYFDSVVIAFLIFRIVIEMGGGKRGKKDWNSIFLVFWDSDVGKIEYKKKS